ncbi:hypothetical protein HJC23_003945 [Cyclotella cryptica]|uniref:Uncharacterized protein n=1 Tax=Cyclotella cryptica TaxID=29204 RepID=A0ABD3PUY9_9STRA
MLLKASRSTSSTEIKKAFQGDCGAHVAACDIISSDSNDESQQRTPRINNTRADSCPTRALETAASSEASALLRVNVLYFEGIASPSIPSGGVSVWVGFRSSFPPDSMTVQSPSYSSYFLKEGNVLAIESDQVKWTPAIQDDNDDSNTNNYSFGYNGVAFWDSLHSVQSPHLEIVVPPLPDTWHNDDEDQPHQLPDILEFHVRLVCETDTISPANDSTTVLNSTWRRLKSRTQSSMSLNKWDDLMEEEHWYKDDVDDTSTCDEIPITQFSQEQHHPHGIAHLKLSRDPNSPDGLDSSAKILPLPIRVIPPHQSSDECGKEGTENNVTVLQNAILSIQVEKISASPEMKSKDSADNQRHYVSNTWNGGNELLPNHAPHSVKCDDDDDSQQNEQKNVSPTRHFHFNKMKGIASRSKSKSGNIMETEQVTEDSLSVDQGMFKIHQALESSIKAVSDRRGLAAALRQNRETDPVSPGRGSRCGEDNDAVLNQTLFKNTFHDDQHGSVHPKFESIAVNESLSSCRLLNGGNGGLAIAGTQSSAHSIDNLSPLSKHANDPGAQKEKDQVSSSRKISVMKRLFCGASMELADVMHHCDEDHAGIYRVDSQSLGSSIAT